MSKAYDTAVLIGSLRKGSYNRKIAEAMMELAPPSLKMEIVEIGGLSFYNQDYDDNPPQDWVAFRKRIQAAQAFLFFTPEYNRSTAPALKNALDIASRPYGANMWGGKPAGVVSVSTGAIGAFGANHHLRQSLVFLNMPALPQPEAYIGGVEKCLDEAGKVSLQATKDFLNSYMQAYAAWVARIAGVLPAD